MTAKKPNGLPDPRSLVVEFVPICCRDGIREWLDELRKLKADGNEIPATGKLEALAREADYTISRTTIQRHLKGLCGSA